MSPDDSHNDSHATAGTIVGGDDPTDSAVARLERQSAEHALIADLLLTLGRTLDPSAIRREVLGMALALTGAERVRLAIRDGNCWEASTLAGGQEASGEWMPMARAPGLVADGKPLALLGDTGEAGLSSYLGVPFCHQGAVVGVLEVENLSVTDRLDDYLQTLSLVASAASLALANARLHESVRQSNERFQLAASAVRSAIYDWDVVKGLVLWTDGITRVFGYLPEEVGPTIEWWLGRIHATDRPRVRDQLVGDISAGRDFVAEYRVCTREGQYLAVWNRGRAVRGAEGRVVRMVGSVEDVTELKRTQEVLAAERERLAVTLRSIGDGMIATDVNGRVVLLNRVAEDLTGWTQEAAVGRPLDEVFHIINQATRERCDNPVAKVLQTGRIVGLANDTALLARDGTERCIADSAAPIRDSQGNVLGVVLVFRDVTALHELQEQREAFIHTVSHDLRTPLTVIQGHAQLLQRALERAGLRGPERRNVEAILTGARRMNVLTHDLVDWARGEAGQLILDREPVSLAAAVQELLEQTRGVLDVGRVAVETSLDLPPVRADPNRLERILVNLLSNALKYSSPGTAVVIKAESRGGEVVVSLADRGAGIAPADRPRIFERFYRGSGAQRAEGMGLGLYATKMLVEAHGGRIWFESEPGMGSTFFFTLPLA